MNTNDSKFQDKVIEYADTLCLYSKNPEKLEKHTNILNNFLRTKIRLLKKKKEHFVFLRQLLNIVLNLNDVELSLSRKKEFITPVKEFCYISYEYYGNKQNFNKEFSFTFEDIATIINRDHTTVKFHHGNLKDLIEVDKKFKNYFFEKYGHLL